MTKEKKGGRIRVQSDSGTGGGSGEGGTTVSLRNTPDGEGGSRRRSAKKGEGGILEPRPIKGVVVAVDTTPEEVGADSTSQARAVETDTYAVIPSVSAEPCTCEGACQEGRPAEYCANWIARTHKMTLQRCSISGQRTWHMDGVCTDCYPMFPQKAFFR